MLAYLMTLNRQNFQFMFTLNHLRSKAWYEMLPVYILYVCHRTGYWSKTIRCAADIPESSNHQIFHR